MRAPQAASQPVPMLQHRQDDKIVTSIPNHHPRFHLAPAFFAAIPSSRSFFPPRSISRCPALLARDFSVTAVKPAECFYILQDQHS